MNTLNIKSSEILTDSEGKPTIPHQNIMKSELRESIIRSQAILMMSRNSNKNYIIKRVMKRFMRCMREF